MQQHIFIQDENSRLYFNTLFSALSSMAAVLNRPMRISANQNIVTAQALSQSAAALSFSDVDYYGLCAEAEDERLVLTDYAGIMPESSSDIAVWLNGAGYLGGEPNRPVTIIDLQTLKPDAKAAGAILICEDEKLLAEIKLFASLAVQKGHLWNDKVTSTGIDGLMQPLVLEYWQSNQERFITDTKKTEEIAAYYTREFSDLKLVELMETKYPRFYPLKLTPELFCPKEDIFSALLEADVDVQVPFKPLYRYKAFAGESLPGCALFYKAVLSLPIHGINMDEAKRIAEAFKTVIEKYAYRGCSF